MVRVPAALSSYLGYMKNANGPRRVQDLQGKTIEVRRNQASLPTM